MIKEAMLINSDRGPLLNRDTGLDLPGCWHVALKDHLRHAQQHACPVVVDCIISFLNPLRSMDLTLFFFIFFYCGLKASVEFPHFQFPLPIPLLNLPAGRESGGRAGLTFGELIAFLLLDKGGTFWQFS